MLQKKWEAARSGAATATAFSDATDLQHPSPRQVHFFKSMLARRKTVTHYAAYAINSAMVFVNLHFFADGLA